MKSDLCEDVPGLLDAALVCEHCSDPVGRPDVSRVVLQHILEVVDGSILILPLLEHNELVCCGSGSVGSLYFGPNTSTDPGPDPSINKQK